MQPAAGAPDTFTPETQVKQVLARAGADPIRVQGDTALADLPAMMAQQPDCHTIAVVDDGGVLIGILPVEAVVQSLLVRVMPSEFLMDMQDPDKAAALAREQHARLVRDLMLPPVGILEGEPVKDAFHTLHRAALAGAPVVDGQGHVVGYLGLLQLVRFGLRR